MSEARKHAEAADRRGIQDAIPGVAAARAMDERELQGSVIEMAHLYGYRVAHFRNVQVIRGGRRVWEVPVQADGKGFPDLVMVNRRRRRVIWAELKSTTGRLTPEQRIWRDDLTAAGVDYVVWTPRDWPDAIKTYLRRDA